ncbi:DUF4147 domain-containing protein [Rhizobium leguminosarum]|uniref:DUF4147 domain-containing protein n=1 Tax=Rhizobium TaxID=379 RepID=UPI0010375CB9|nr:DUF4147 domain-containing protein [Rhizobium leguminosarum]TBF85837.1 DUF4147 domain-containing protein [Rhizobium leguminosarum]
MQLAMQSSHSTIKMRESVRSIFLSGAKGACSRIATKRLLSRRSVELHDCKHVVLISVGQSACQMAETYRAAMPENVRSTAILSDALCPDEVLGALRVRHERGGASTRIFADGVRNAVRTVGTEAVGIFLLSAGHQAMLSTPPFGVEHSMRNEIQQLLVSSKARSDEIMAVRNALSVIDDRRLMAALGLSRAISVRLSTESPSEAKSAAAAWTRETRRIAQDSLKILERYGLAGTTERFPYEHIMTASGINVPPENALRLVPVTTYNDGIRAASEAAKRFGWVKVHHFSTALSADRAANEIFRVARETASVRRPTVVLFGQNGARKRSHELALRFAILEERDRLNRPWVLLSGCTTGESIFETNIGAVVDGGSSAWIRQSGFEPRTNLIGDAARQALEVSGDLLVANERINPLNLDVLFLGEQQ